MQGHDGVEGVDSLHRGKGQGTAQVQLPRGPQSSQSMGRHHGTTQTPPFPQQAQPTTPRRQPMPSRAGPAAGTQQTGHTASFRVKDQGPPVLHFPVCKTSRLLPSGNSAFGTPHHTAPHRTAPHHTTPHHTTPHHTTPHHTTPHHTTPHHTTPYLRLPPRGKLYCHLRKRPKYEHLQRVLHCSLHRRAPLMSGGEYL